MKGKICFLFFLNFAFSFSQGNYILGRTAKPERPKWPLLSHRAEKALQTKGQMQRDIYLYVAKHNNKIERRLTYKWRRDSGDRGKERKETVICSSVSDE